ncbi:hypothetical protein VQW79_02060 [Helicobacter pylori]
MIISIHFKIEPFQKLVKFLSASTKLGCKSKSFFSNLIVPFWHNQHYI